MKKQLAYLADVEVHFNDSPINSFASSEEIRQLKMWVEQIFERTTPNSFVFSFSSVVRHRAVSPDKWHNMDTTCELLPNRGYLKAAKWFYLQAKSSYWGDSHAIEEMFFGFPNSYPQSLLKDDFIRLSLAAAVTFFHINLVDESRNIFRAISTLQVSSDLKADMALWRFRLFGVEKGMESEIDNADKYMLSTFYYWSAIAYEPAKQPSDFDRLYFVCRRSLEENPQNIPALECYLRMLLNDDVNNKHYSVSEAKKVFLNALEQLKKATHISQNRIQEFEKMFKHHFDPVPRDKQYEKDLMQIYTLSGLPRYTLGKKGIFVNEIRVETSEYSAITPHEFLLKWAENFFESEDPRRTFITKKDYASKLEDQTDLKKAIYLVSKTDSKDIRTFTCDFCAAASGFMGQCGSNERSQMKSAIENVLLGLRTTQAEQSFESVVLVQSYKAAKKQFDAFIDSQALSDWAKKELRIPYFKALKVFLEKGVATLKVSDEAYGPVTLNMVVFLNDLQRSLAAEYVNNRSRMRTLVSESKLYSKYDWSSKTELGQQLAYYARDYWNMPVSGLGNILEAQEVLLATHTTRSPSLTGLFQLLDPLLGAMKEENDAEELTALTTAFNTFVTSYIGKDKRAALRLSLEEQLYHVSAALVPFFSSKELMDFCVNSEKKLLGHLVQQNLFDVFASCITVLLNEVEQTIQPSPTMVYESVSDMKKRINNNCEVLKGKNLIVDTLLNCANGIQVGSKLFESIKRQPEFLERLVLLVKLSGDNKLGLNLLKLIQQLAVQQPHVFKGLKNLDVLVSLAKTGANPEDRKVGLDIVLRVATVPEFVCNRKDFVDTHLVQLTSQWAQLWSSESKFIVSDLQSDYFVRMCELSVCRDELLKHKNRFIRALMLKPSVVQSAMLLKTLLKTSESKETTAKSGGQMKKLFDQVDLDRTDYSVEKFENYFKEKIKNKSNLNQKILTILNTCAWHKKQKVAFLIVLALSKLPEKTVLDRLEDSTWSALSILLAQPQPNLSDQSQSDRSSFGSVRRKKKELD